jgi:hypothetical protein
MWVVVQLKTIQSNSKSLLAGVICLNWLDVVRNGKLLRGLLVGGADFEGYQRGFSALNRVVVRRVSSPLTCIKAYCSSLQSQTVEDVPKPSFATTWYRDWRTAPRWIGKYLPES